MTSAPDAPSPPGRPRPSLAFRDRSVYTGVARREIGSVDLVAHSVAVVVPSLTALGTGLAFPGFIGPGFWLSTLLGYSLVGLLAFTVNQFVSRFQSAGTHYTFVAKGLGPLPGLVVAAGLVIGYAAMIGFGLSDAASRGTAALTAAGLDESAGPGRELVLLAVGSGLCLYAIHRGLLWSTRASLLAEVVSFVALGAVLVAWIGRYGPPTWQALSLEGASAGRILTGAGLIVVLTLAFESSASLGLEATRPFAQVPFALRSSVLLAAVLFALANLVATARPVDAPSVWGFRWFAPGAPTSVLDALVLVVLAWSLLALALCVWCAVSRLIFSLAREGVLPSALGRLNARGVPVVAALAITPLALLPPVASLVAGPGSGSIAWELKESSAVVLCATYALTSLALILFLRSIDELSRVVLGGTSIAGLAAASVAVNALLTEREDGSWRALVMLAAALGLGVAMWAYARRRRVSRGPAERYVGMHDEALASDVRLRPADQDGYG